MISALVPIFFSLLLFGLPTFAALGIPEVWRFSDDVLIIRKLDGGGIPLVFLQNVTASWS